jgi:hypothetical protein
MFRGIELQALAARQLNYMKKLHELQVCRAILKVPAAMPYSSSQSREVQKGA